MSQWSHFLKQMVEISLLISVSRCDLVPLCFGLSAGEYTRQQQRLETAVAVGWGVMVPGCRKPSAGFNEMLFW